MLLSKLLSAIKVKYQRDNERKDFDISNIEIDSRLVKENAIFVALKGQKVDGHDFINMAISNGAKVIVIDEKYEIPNNVDVVFIKTRDVFLFLTEILKAFYSPLPKNIYALTGTNGKTSIVEFIRQILENLGKKSASIGTLGVRCSENILDLNKTPLTTPDIVSFYKNLSILKKNDVDDVAIEASSIGLEQRRINGIELACGAFSNFTLDHLDYHRSKENYFAAKMMLFKDFMSDKSNAILNADIEEFPKIKEICQKKNHRIISYGKAESDLQILKINSTEIGQRVEFSYKNENYNFDLALNGEFQVYNVLCALGNILAIYDLKKAELEKLLLTFKNLKSADGRMDLIVTLANEAKIFIDFAHTPDALMNVLNLAKNIAKKRVLVMFGCGGDRDKTKRSKMGEIAAKLADFVIVTDDNPRNEDADAIRKEIISGINNNNFIEISPRDLAIKESIAMLKMSDILILAGKGHEKYQIIGDKKYDFDEVKIIYDAISKLPKC